MREVLDRLREAETKLDERITQEFRRCAYWGAGDAMTLLWIAKYHLWQTTMLVLRAATGDHSVEPT